MHSDFNQILNCQLKNECDTQAHDQRIKNSFHVDVIFTSFIKAITCIYKVQFSCIEFQIALQIGEFVKNNKNFQSAHALQLMRD